MSESESMDGVENVEDVQRGKYMTFQTGKELFGISISYVNEIVGMQPITEVPEEDGYIRGLINLRGEIIPVIDVRVRFGMEPLEYTDRTCIIVINVKSKAVGLIVEKIAEVDTIPDDKIVDPPNFSGKSMDQHYIYGIARTENTVKLLINPEKLIVEEDFEFFEEMQEEAEIEDMDTGAETEMEEKEHV